MSMPLATVRTFARLPSGFIEGMTRIVVSDIWSIRVGSSVNARSRIFCSDISRPAGSLPCWEPMIRTLRPSAMSSSLGAVG